MHVAGGVRLGDEWGVEERSHNPSTPSWREPLDQFGNGFGVVLNWKAALALLGPPFEHASHHRPDLWALKAHSCKCSSDLDFEHWSFVTSAPRFRPNEQPPDRPHLGT